MLKKNFIRNFVKRKINKRERTSKTSAEVVHRGGWWLLSRGTWVRIPGR
jgi:hypothetical protein